MNIKSAKTKVVLGVSSVALVLGLGATSYAAIPDSTTGEITACRVSGDAGNTRIIDKESGDSCHSYEQEISWDSTGGVTGYQRVSDSGVFSSLGSNIHTLSVTCPTGKKATGGGYVIANPAGISNVSVYSDTPSSDTTWQIKFFLNGGADRTMTVYAICVDA